MDALSENVEAAAQIATQAAVLLPSVRPDQAMSCTQPGRSPVIPEPQAPPQPQACDLDLKRKQFARRHEA